MKRTILSLLLLCGFGVIVQAEPLGWVKSDTQPFQCGQTIKIAAQAEANFEFDKWNDGNTENPREVEVSSEAIYTAYFKAATPTANEEIPSAPVARKVLIDNKLYILVDDILYDATGKRVR